MIPHPPSGHEDLKAYVVGLAFGCPLDQGNTDDCPFRSARLESLHDRLNWVHTMDHGALKALARHHCACLAHREPKLR
jgi:hypothetical protein